LPAGAKAAPAQASHAAAPRQDSGTVVGTMPTAAEDESIEQTRAYRQLTPRVQALPAARALARRLGVDLTTITGSGRNGAITIEDVEAAGAGASVTQKPSRARALQLGGRLAGDFEPLYGAQRAMAEAMSHSRDEVALATIFDDADISAWPQVSQVTPRVLRAMVAGARAEPALNAVFDPSVPARRMLRHIDVALAVDVGDKLITPVLRDIADKSLAELRAEIDRLKQAARERTLAPEELRDFTISFSNFGTVAGRYATPLVTPPSVAILGTGSIRRDVVAVGDKVAVHPRIPLSLSFDHRCITGGEACRFLAAVIEDLIKP
jgi:pyruvate dehydrogenase E2 component (dihydrolipoamide acetyltransferase)